MTVQLLIPTILALIIVGVIGDKQSAVSWYDPVCLPLLFLNTYAL